MRGGEFFVNRLAVSYHLNLFFPYRLLPNTRTREKVFSSLSILGAFIGGAALILLSVFDTKRHMVAHRLFLLIFVLGVSLSAIFTVIEVNSNSYLHLFFFFLRLFSPPIRGSSQTAFFNQRSVLPDFRTRVVRPISHSFHSSVRIQNQRAKTCAVLRSCCVL